MPLECSSTSATYQWREVKEIERALSTMRRYGISEVSAPYQQLSSLRGKLIGQIGFKFPTPISLIAKLIGLSPGIIKVWHHAESGWMSEARARPGASPVYRSVSDEVAMAILKKEVTPELEKVLMTPDPYIGE